MNWRDEEDNCKERQHAVPGTVFHLVGAIHLKLNGHLAAGLVAVGGRIHQGGVLVIGVLLGHHHIQHDTGVGDL